jgi:hypothetical protein
MIVGPYTLHQRSHRTLPFIVRLQE